MISPDKSTGREPQLVVSLRPVFIGWITLLMQLPLQLFFTVWCGGFFGGLSRTFCLFPRESWLPFQLFGLLGTLLANGAARLTAGRIDIDADRTLIALQGALRTIYEVEGRAAVRPDSALAELSTFADRLRETAFCTDDQWRAVRKIAT